MDQTQLEALSSIKAKLFGEFRIEAPNGDTISLTNRRASLLLAILCIEPGHAMDREALARLLWADRFVPQAKASLRQCLLKLQRTLMEYGVDALAVSRSEVALNPNSLRCDLGEIEAAFVEGQTDPLVDQLLSIGNRPLLQGVSLNPAFDEWLAERRVHVDARLRSGLSEAIRSAAKPTAERLTEAAKVRFASYRAFHQLTHEATLALLPFAQIDTVGGNFFLPDGIVDELSTRLAGIQGIALAGRTSVNVVAAKGGTLTEIAGELGVSYLIEGEVRRRDQDIEIRIALINGSTGTELWSDRLTGSITHFFDGRQIIGTNVIAAICSALGLAVTPSPSRKMTRDREAYALYLQGRYMIQRVGGAETYEKGIQLYEQALEIDPEFAECWTALANAYIMTAALTPSLKRLEQSAEGARCAERALMLDSDQGHAYSILGIHEWTNFNPARALELAYEAYARDPNDADVCSRLGSCLLYLGKAKEALPFVEAAVDRDPVYARNHMMLASAHLCLGDFDTAYACGQRMGDLGLPSIWSALALMAQGQHDKAVETYYASRILLGTIIMPPPGMAPMDEAARDAYFGMAARGVCSGDEDARAIYCQVIDGLHVTMPDPYDHSIAFAAIWLGHSELVMKLYSERIHPANMFGLASLWIDIDPINRTIRHSDFMAFAERIGMVEAWDRFGWPDLIPKDPRTA
ncbi:MAG: tetratricopeptide repeat protein [Pseudomonadota bacterium]